jgi:hypothetical protein
MAVPASNQDQRDNAVYSDGTFIQTSITQIARGKLLQDLIERKARFAFYRPSPKSSQELRLVPVVYLLCDPTLRLRIIYVTNHGNKIWCKSWNIHAHRIASPSNHYTSNKQELCNSELKSYPFEHKVSTKLKLNIL